MFPKLDKRIKSPKGSFMQLPQALFHIYIKQKYYRGTINGRAGCCRNFMATKIWTSYQALPPTFFWVQCRLPCQPLFSRVVYWFRINKQSSFAQRLVNICCVWSSQVSVPIQDQALPLCERRGTGHCQGSAERFAVGIGSHQSSHLCSAQAAAPQEPCLECLGFGGWGGSGTPLCQSWFPPHRNTQISQVEMTPSPVWRINALQSVRGLESVERGLCKNLHWGGMFKQSPLRSSVIITQGNQLFFCYLWSPP